MVTSVVTSASPHTGSDVVGWWLTVLQLAAGGIVATAAFAWFGVIWRRSHVPKALERRVGRSTYMKAVLTESERQAFLVLDVLAPRLTPSANNTRIIRIQKAWKQINDSGQVRVLTLDSRSCLVAGLELQRSGIAVRVARRGLDSEDLSYHIFGQGGTTGTAIINHHHGRFDRPMRLVGKDPIKVFRDNFEHLWQAASSLEAVSPRRSLSKSLGRGSLSRL